MHLKSINKGRKIKIIFSSNEIFHANLNVKCLFLLQDLIEELLGLFYFYRSNKFILESGIRVWVGDAIPSVLLVISERIYTIASHNVKFLK